MTLLEPRKDFDKCIIGICHEEGRAIYDADRVISVIMTANDLSREDAEEWFADNTVRGAAYQENPPIFMSRDFELDD